MKETTSSWNQCQVITNYHKPITASSSRSVQLSHMAVLSACMLYSRCSGMLEHSPSCSKLLVLAVGAWLHGSCRAGQAGRDLWRSQSPAPFLLQQVPCSRSHRKASTGNLQRRLLNLSVILDDKKSLSFVSMEFPVLRFLLLAPCSVAKTAVGFSLSLL